MTDQKKLEILIDKWGGKLIEKMRDPLFFINEIVGVGLGNGKLNPYQEYWIKLVFENKLTNITAFRSSGKTESIGVLFPIFKAFTQANWWGIVVSAKEEQSKEILQRIKTKVEQNPILSTSIPKNKSTSWSKTEINFTNGSRILAKPYTDRLRSWHVNWALFDEAGEYRDLDVYESNAYSITQARWSVEGSGVCVVGTPKSEMDLLHKLRKNKDFVSKVYPANMKLSSIDVSYKHHPKANKTLWEIRYPRMSLLSKKRQINNNMKFTREFLCRVLSSGEELFPYYMIEAAFDYERGFIKKRDTQYSYYIGLDFALSGESGADYSVYAVYEQDRDKFITRLVKLERYKGLSYGAQKLRIKQLNDIFRPVKVIADEGTFGKAFIQELKSDGIPIKGFRFQHKRQELLEVFKNAFEINFTEDKDKKGLSIPLPFNERKFFINYSEKDTVCVKLIDELVNELRGFGVVFKTSRTGNLTGSIKFESVKKHDDIVMACALGWWGCARKKPSKFIVYRSRHANSNILFSKT